MKVENWMTKKVVTIGPDAGVRDALLVMKKNDIRHLPVVEGEFCTGLVTSNELKQAILASMIESLKVSDLMIRKPHVISKDTSLEKAARLINDENVGCLPVIEDGHVIGIITVKDILRAFIEIMGVLKSGSRIDVILKSVHGSFDEVVSIFQKNNSEIISVGMSINEDQTVHHFRISGGDTASIVEELRKLGYRGVNVTD